MVLVSVCIVTMNRKDMLRQCIDSILNQQLYYNNRFIDLEFIIYDNNSSDGTKEYLQWLESADNRFRILHNDTNNSNAIETLNITFKHASGRYILVMDDDAYFQNNFGLKYMVDAAESNINIGIVASNVQFLTEREDGALSQMPIRLKDGRFLSTSEIYRLSNVLDYYEFHGACALFNRRIVEILGFYDESFGIYINEFDLACNVLDVGYRVVFCNDVIAKHHQVSYNKCNKNNIRYLRNFNTVITRAFKHKKIRAVTLRTGMLYMMHIENILKYCSKMQFIKFTLQTAVVYLQSLYRCFFPDKVYTFVNREMQDYMEQSLYNSFKNNIKSYIMRLIRR